jgi:hypothetical protein
MVLDIASLPDSSSSSEDEDFHEELTVDLDAARTRRKKKGLGRLHISHLLQMVLQDAQTRLFFKAQAVIQSEVRYYVPKAEDLAYPEKLVGELDMIIQVRHRWSVFPTFCQLRGSLERDMR